MNKAENDLQKKITLLEKQNEILTERTDIQRLYIEAQKHNIGLLTEQLQFTSNNHTFVEFRVKFFLN